MPSGAATGDVKYRLAGGRPLWETVEVTVASARPRQLHDGLQLRPAVPDDRSQIEELLAARGESVDAVDFGLIVDDPDSGWPACAVVTDGGKVVSTATLLDEKVNLCGVELAAGQVELVATDSAYEGQGLVRALMEWAHARSAERGHIVQFMIGIPYFYRLFGYVYAPPIAAKRPLAARPPTTPGHVVRQAGLADIPAMAALQDAAQSAADLTMPHSPGCWRWLVHNEATVQWVVERDTAVVATGRSTPPGEQVTLAEIAGVDDASVHALAAHMFTVGARGEPSVQVNRRPGTVSDDALHPYFGPESDSDERYYVRVPDPVVLLEQLRPVLTQRLAAASLDAPEGEALISFYRSHVRFDYGPHGVGPMRGGGTMQWPADGGAAAPPDVVGPLLFGDQGFDALNRQHPDMWANKHLQLMRALFPPVSSDILSFYLP